MGAPSQVGAPSQCGRPKPLWAPQASIGARGVGQSRINLRRGAAGPRGVWRALVDDGVGLGVEEGQDASDVLRLVERVGAHHLADQFEHDELEHVTVARHLLGQAMSAWRGGRMAGWAWRGERVARWGRGVGAST